VSTRWSNANVNISLDDLGGQLSKTQKSAAPTMKELQQQQTSTPGRGFLALVQFYKAGRK